MKAERPIDVSLYVAALPVIASAPLCAADRLLPAPGLLPLAMGLILGGVPLSLAMRRRGVDRVRLNRIVTLVTLLGGVLYFMAASDPRRLFAPQRILDSSIDGLAMSYLIRLITWVIAFRAVTLLTDTDVLLSIGFSLSLFILVALVEPEAWVLLCLFPCVAGSLYLLIRNQRNNLVARADLVVGGGEGGWPRQEVFLLATLGGLIATLSLLLSLALSDVEVPSQVIESRLVATLSAYMHDVHSDTMRGGLETSMDVADARGSISPAVVFEVETPRPELWRGNVFNVFDGQEWRVGLERSYRPAMLRPGLFLLDETAAPPDPDAAVRHRFRFERAGQHLLYTVNGAYAIEVERRGLRVSTLGRVQTFRATRRGTEYSVYARSPELPLPPVETAIPREIAQTYLHVAYTPPERVRQLVAEVTAGVATPAARVGALMNYLSGTKFYTKRPRPIPPEADAVEYFLFEMDAGWCRHFATALAVCAREAGVPARLVTGFTPGERSGPATYLVRERDLHAWVEAWLPGRGWVTYDVSAQTTERTAGLALVIQALRNGLAQVRLWLGPAGPPVLGGGLALLVGAVLWWQRPALRAWAARRRAGRPRHHWPQPAGRLYERLRREAARAGLGREPSDTALRVAARLAAVAPDLRAELLSAAESLSRARYGRTNATASELAAIARTLAALRRRRPVEATGD